LSKPGIQISFLAHRSTEPKHLSKQADHPMWQRLRSIVTVVYVTAVLFTLATHTGQARFSASTHLMAKASVTAVNSCSLCDPPDATVPTKGPTLAIPGILTEFTFPPGQSRQTRLPRSSQNDRAPPVI
jgi:hypothetical protein